MTASPVIAWTIRKRPGPFERGCPISSRSCRRSARLSHAQQQRASNASPRFVELLDDFIGAIQHRGWDRHSQCFRRLEIDEQFEPRGLFHGKVAGPGTFEKLVDVACRISELVKDAWTEAHESTGLGKLTELGSDRDLVLLAELRHPRPMGDLNCVLRRHYGLGADLHCGFEALVQIVGYVQLERVELHSESWRRHLDLFQFLNDAGVGSTPEDSQAGQCRKNLLQQLQAFGRQFGRKKAGACNVSSRPGEAGDEASRYRVANGCHDDGNRLGRLPSGVGRLGSSRQDSVDLALNELGGKRRQASGLPLCVPELKPDIPSISPPTLLERGREHTNASLRLWVALDVWQEETQAPHTVRLLRTRDAVPSECGPTQQYEDAASLHELPRMRCALFTAREPSSR